MIKDTLPKVMRDFVRSLGDHSLDVLQRAASAEIRRRKRIHQINAGWTSGQGLEVCLQASIKKDPSP